MDCYKHFFYDFLKIQVTSYGSFEEMKKGTSAIHGATFFVFLSKRALRHEKEAWRRAILFYFRQNTNNNADIKLVHINSKSNSLSDCLSRWSMDKKYREKFNGIISEAEVKY